ncbi:MAG: bifunctional (p)ppGpp synthetase/guanosine-3',5'-bis(diphosphate) 3'-pyrophosphohydrolase [Ignavibacteria bacterium]|jgi:RelA/SpoT family (p)ppGpp synthetase|nr:bifunctional (p)ppGpp synthetase/guanosine-3',5'-bis(diphosphate) 3'-pyrophosphohydrolase [Ignavibacteria bacterium]MCU7504069.1 bifunctional (p)ppGpp synthetase/guanosine-3',5'-bis(diphosphate) 3'-pyrophosphohydrolase [Ignavibacteria bacterium]MCU7518262.1 bifunctional (p)ppGpp synthetase/guanosine-3',5'-bis(diphosphate) 3'-pyrophosphohydrolase [Ignavibacteria bacterium]
MALGVTKNKRIFDELLETCKHNLPSVDEAMLKKAFELSYDAHKNDFRASGEPYFNHPYEVAMIVAKEIPLDDISVISALLHDVVEDTEIDISLIAKEFGKEVAEIVDGVTKMGGVFKGQEITQAENYRKMLLSMVKDVRVILVKFADRLHNMRTLEFVNPDKQRRIARETLEIYAPFAHRFGLARVKWELEDLSFKYLNKEAYDDLARKIKNKRRERESYINKFNTPVIDKLKEHGLKFEISGRPKHLYSIYRKMIKRNKPFEEIYDLFAVRIILESNDSNECYYVLGIINQIYIPVPDRFKDYVSIPKTNNYQSIHTTVIGPEGKLVEVQIRTRKMHEVAEKGVAAHWKYKENKFTSDAELEEWVNWIRDVFENASKDEASKEILASFKLNLYQDEIYVFTPKGDLRRLPVNSTPVDFAFEIHSKVGYHCIGAKVNGKIVPLDTILHSGDQVEIITSKNQHPNRSWAMFVTTHKSKAAIRRWINKEEEQLIQSGKELWEKKVKKMKLSFNSDDTIKLAKSLKFDGSGQLFKAIAQEKVNLDEVLAPKKENEAKSSVPELEFDSFANIARTDIGGILVDGKSENVMYSFAKCCNPIPGDPIVGYITIGEGIKIHRKTCDDLINIVKKGENRLVPVQWPTVDSNLFVAGLTIVGEDVPGILKDISHSITSYQNTNIKSVNILANNSMFKGTITLYVRNLEHLSRIIERLKKNKGIYTVERFDSTNLV